MLVVVVVILQAGYPLVPWVNDFSVRPALTGLSL